MRFPQDPQPTQLTTTGIHGRPFKEWNGVKGLKTFNFGGYCTHSSVLFVPWHRPYLALFEVCRSNPYPKTREPLLTLPQQALYAVAQGVAAKFPAAIRDRHVAAAKILRLPYWDFAMRPPAGTTAFPGALSAPTITVIDTDGRTKAIRNPLHQFDFHPVNPSAGDFDDQVRAITLLSFLSFSSSQSSS